MAVYVVWVPALNFQGPATLQKNGSDAAKLIPDSRVRFYSDPKDLAGAAYGKVMKIPHGAPAWDIYFVFGANIGWRDEPPKPWYWMHQLWDMDPKLLLNGPVFFERVKQQLSDGSHSNSGALCASPEGSTSDRRSLEQGGILAGCPRPRCVLRCPARRKTLSFSSAQIRVLERKTRNGTDLRLQPDIIHGTGARVDLGSSPRAV